MRGALWVVVGWVLLMGFCFAGATDETRYCGPPARKADGSIARSSHVLAAFRRVHPCPTTGETAGACPGWQIDHVIPLACGGCDGVSNLQWLPTHLKTAAIIGKDRFERRIYGGHVVGTECGVPPL